MSQLCPWSRAEVQIDQSWLCLKYHIVVKVRGSRDTSRQNCWSVDWSVKFWRWRVLTLGYINLDRLSGLCRQLLVFKSWMLVPRIICYLRDVGFTTTSLCPPCSISASKPYRKYFIVMLLRYEAHLSEATLTDEFIEDGEVVLARPLGLPLSAWEDLEE